MHAMTTAQTNQAATQVLYGIVILVAVILSVFGAFAPSARADYFFPGYSSGYSSGYSNNNYSNNSYTNPNVFFPGYSGSGYSGYSSYSPSYTNYYPSYNTFFPGYGYGYGSSGVSGNVFVAGRNVAGYASVYPSYSGNVAGNVAGNAGVAFCSGSGRVCGSIGFGF